MKELLDLLNDMKYEYPECEGQLDDILDKCLTTIESGGDKKEAMRVAKEQINDIRKFDR